MKLAKYFNMVVNVYGKSISKGSYENVVRDRVGNRPYTRNTNNVQEEKVGNLTSRQVELVKELIHGNREVKNHTSMGKSTP